MTAPPTAWPPPTPSPCKPVNDAPTLTATGNIRKLFQRRRPVLRGGPASTVEAGQSLDQLKLTVTNISGTATDSLSIDGVTVALTNGQCRVHIDARA